MGDRQKVSATKSIWNFKQRTNICTCSCMHRSLHVVCIYTCTCSVYSTCMYKYYGLTADRLMSMSLSLRKYFTIATWPHIAANPNGPITLCTEQHTHQYIYLWCVSKYLREAVHAWMHNLKKKRLVEHLSIKHRAFEAGIYPYFCLQWCPHLAAINIGPVLYQ